MVFFFLLFSFFCNFLSLSVFLKPSSPQHLHLSSMNCANFTPRCLPFQPTCHHPQIYMRAAMTIVAIIFVYNKFLFRLPTTQIYSFTQHPPPPPPMVTTYVCETLNTRNNFESRRKGADNGTREMVHTWFRATNLHKLEIWSRRHYSNCWKLLQFLANTKNCLFCPNVYFPQVFDVRS